LNRLQNTNGFIVYYTFFLKFDIHNHHITIEEVGTDEQKALLERACGSLISPDGLKKASAASLKTIKKKAKEDKSDTGKRVGGVRVRDYKNA